MRHHSNLFLLSVSNFSCAIDAFTHALLASELGSKPYLILEIDAHTADAGLQTRLEAFLDIVENYRSAHPAMSSRSRLVGWSRAEKFLVDGEGAGRPCAFHDSAVGHQRKR